MQEYIKLAKQARFMLYHKDSLENPLPVIAKLDELIKSMETSKLDLESEIFNDGYDHGYQNGIQDSKK